MASPPWLKVRRELGHQPILAGRIGGPTPVFVERYLYQAIDRMVSGLDTAGLLVQFGGGRVREGEPDHWRSMNLPSQSMLIPKGVATHWHYSGTVDFAVFYFLDGGGSTMQSLELLAQTRSEPVKFSDPLVGAAAQQLLAELHKGPGTDEGFMERLAGVMMEQTFRTLTTPGSRGIHPSHVHFFRLQAVLNFVHDNPTRNLSVSKPRLARRREPGALLPHLSRCHGCAPPSVRRWPRRLDLARKLLTQSSLPISRIAEESGFSSQSHLTACFRSAHSTTPAQYRANRRPAVPPHATRARVNSPGL